MLGSIPDGNRLLHVSVRSKDGLIVSLCEIEDIGGSFNISVSTVPEYIGSGYEYDCVRESIEWWVDSYYHHEHDLNWWFMEDDSESISIAYRNGFIDTGDNGGFDGFLHYAI